MKAQILGINSDITIGDLTSLDSLCKKSQSAFVNFIDDGKNVTATYVQSTGRYYDLKPLNGQFYCVENLNKANSKKLHARTILNLIERIQAARTVVFDMKDINHTLVFVVFEGDYRDYISDLVEVELDCRLNFVGFSMDFIPLSLSEYDRAKFSSDVIGYTRRSIGCRQNLSTKQ